MSEQAEGPGQRRAIRSFVLRQGRKTHGQTRALNQLWPQFGLTPDAVPDPASWFGRDAALVLEIGFGNGRALIECARNDPERNYLGIEVHQPGVGQLLLGIEEHGLGNVRAFNHDAVEVLKQNIPADAVDEVRIWFPDPWHKKKHHKRRLIQSAFVQLLTQRLKPGGLLHLATDWVPYAEWMSEVLAAQPALRNLAAPELYSERPEWRPQTHFETRGQRLGHEVRDLLYRKVDSA